MCVCLAFCCHLLLGKGDVKKLLMQNMNSLLSLYTRTHLFQKAVLDDQIVLSGLTLNETNSKGYTEN